MGKPSTKHTMIALVAVALVVSMSFLNVKQAEATHRPSHTQIQSALDLANIYIDDLLKFSSPAEVASSSHQVVAEYMSIPIWVKYNTGKVIRVGEDVDAAPGGPKTTELLDFTEVSSDTVQYRIRFKMENPSTHVFYSQLPQILVTVDYDYGANHNIFLTIKHEAWASQSLVSSAKVYLGSSLKATLSSSTVGQTFTDEIVTNGDSGPAMRSLRYIERHGSQLAYQYLTAIGNTADATEISNRLTAEGYTVGKDIYAPMFKSGVSQPTNFQYESGSNGVYRDCYTEPTMRDRSYQYHSKVCTVGVDTYIQVSREVDWLVPMLWAIHQYNKGVNVDQDVSDGYHNWSIRDVARMAETHWVDPIGINTPNASTHASGVRTAAFLVLETLLGYGPTGDTTSQSYADKAAKALMNPQVKAGGQVVRENEDDTQTTLNRRMYTGGWYTAWNGFNYVAKKSILQEISDLFSQPDEHPDIKPTNAETTIAVAQSLRTYDCYAYGYNCANTP